MAAPPSDDEEFHSLSDHSANPKFDEDASSSIMEPPAHPVESMQGAFEESIAEAAEEDENVKAEPVKSPKSRRNALLAAPEYDDSWTARWKQRPGTTYHPLLKLMAQIVFGMHLLQQGQAKSDEEVVRILQTHVNEVDAFLEHTCEDLDVAIIDIEERVAFLRLPMQHMETFEPMLDNRKFRSELLDGNAKIAKIIERTSLAMNASLQDVRVAMESTRQLSLYHDRVESKWPMEGSDMAEVFEAMRGNEQGWIKFLGDLDIKGGKLGHSLIILSSLMEEMSRLAAAASRRNASQKEKTATAAKHQHSPSSPSLQSKYASPSRRKQDPKLDKPLPRAPGTRPADSDHEIPDAPSIPSDGRYEQPRQRPPTPTKASHRAGHSTVGKSARQDDASGQREPKGPREARILPQSGTRDLAEFLKRSGPTRSTPSLVAPDNSQDHLSRNESTRSPKNTARNIMTSLRNRRPSSAGKPFKHRGALSHTDIPGPASPPVPQAAEPVVDNGGPVQQPPNTSTVIVPPIVQPSQPHPADDNDAASRQYDSAYSSGTRTEHTSSDASDPKHKPADAVTADTTPGPAKDQPPATAGNYPGAQNPASQSSTKLTLFPRESGPMTPAMAASQDKERQAPTEGPAASTPPPAAAPRSSPRGHLRVGSIRRFFHRKGESTTQIPSR